MDSKFTSFSSRGAMVGAIRLMRPSQWIKNTFVFAPLVFAAEFQQLSAVMEVVVAAIMFCVASSAVYIINDYHDIEADRAHPVKKLSRPLASGQLSIPAAFALLSFLCLLFLGLSLYYPRPAVVILIYLLINLAYTYYLKTQPVLDVFTIATGFVLRVYAGAMALLVPVSSWMFVTTLCLALFLASVKRRQELLYSGSNTRLVLQSYSLSLIDKYIQLSATGALLFYSLFVMTVRPQLVVSIPFVIFGLFRYWYLVEIEGGGESPSETLLSDAQLLITAAGWSGICVYVMSTV